MSFPRHDSYRDSGVEWLGEVPAHWVIKPLKREVRLVTDRAEERHRPLGLENIEGWTGRLIETEAEFGGEGVAFRKGDILYGKLRPYLAKVYAAEFQGEAVGDFHVLRPTPTVVARFLAYFLLMRELVSVLDGSTYGAKMPRVGWEFLGGLSLAFPSIAEQVAIAAFLDRETGRIDGLVEAQRGLIALLKEKRQAVISHAVTRGLDPTAPLKPTGIPWLGDVPEHWELMPLRRVTKILSGYAFPSAGFSDDPNETPLLRGVNIGVGTIRWDDVVYWKRAPEDDLESWKLQMDDIVLGMDRPWIGDGLRVAQVGPQDIPCLLLQRVAALRSDNRLQSRYLKLLLQQEAFHHHCVPEMTGVSVPHISPSQISAFSVCLPPTDEQASILAYVQEVADQAERLHSEAERAITLLQERRAALISAAITGKIDVCALASGPQRAEAA